MLERGRSESLSELPRFEREIPRHAQVAQGGSAVSRATKKRMLMQNVCIAGNGIQEAGFYIVRNIVVSDTSDTDKKDSKAKCTVTPRKCEVIEFR